MNILKKVMLSNDSFLSEVYITNEKVSLHLYTHMFSIRNRSY